MKKITALLLSLIIAFSSTGVLAFEGDDSAVTTIRVNADSQTILLNDEPVEFSIAPYKNENWDVMVEIGLIARLLGATVTEEENGCCISLSGIEMHYTKNSDKVMIEDQALLMKAAVDVKSDVLVAPLRFVAETLGADVTYDVESGDVIITTTTLSEGIIDYNVLFKYSGKTKIGHSEQHWRFNKTENFDMAETYYDNEFEFSMGDILITLCAEKNDNSYSLKNCYINMQDDGGYYEKVMFDKGEGTRNGVKYAYTKHRTEDVIIERYAFETKEYYYLIEIERGYENFVTSVESNEVEEFLNSLEFDYCGGEEETTVDLATEDVLILETPEAVYEDEYFNWKLSMCDGWEVSEPYGFYNVVYVTRESDYEADYDSYYYEDPEIEISTFSNINNQSVEEWAKEKYENIKKTVNSKYCEVTPITDVNIGDIPAKYFAMTVSESESSEITKYYFLNNSNYRYKIVFTYNKAEEKNENFLNGAETVINSFVPGEIDEEEIGQVLEVDSDISLLDETITFEGDMYKISYPCNWSVSESNGILNLSENDMDISDILGIYEIISPQLTFLLTASEEISLNVSKESLAYYGEDLKRKTYKPREYVNKKISDVLNMAVGQLEISMTDDIKETTMFGLKGYSVELEIIAMNEVMHQTLYYLQYDNENIILVRKNCIEEYKNTVYEKALDRAIDSLKLISGK